PIYQSGVLVGFAKITRDITERYDAQNKLIDAERELVQAQKAEAIGKLTFGLAHDFNNLLAVIVNSIDMVAMQPEATPKIKRLLETGLGAAERGALLTRQLLGFAQGQKLAPEPHDLNVLLSRSEDLYRRGAGSSITLKLTLGEDLPMVLVDATQFEAAIFNLVSNSRDAMNRGGNIRIGTSLVKAKHPTQLEGDARGLVCVSVSDTGTGMSEEVLRRSAEPFFTTKEVGKGSGLGLSQVFGFAAQSGGFASIESELGKGSAIHLCLPPLGD
ncbi:MAG: PAS domain-containing sensor histidine kinase, partial [Alphaproteobacteria bacterium]